MLLGLAGGGGELLSRLGVAGCCGVLRGVAGGSGRGGALEHELQSVRADLERVAVIECGLAGRLTVDRDADWRLHVINHPTRALLAYAGVEGRDVHVAAQWDMSVFGATEEGLGGVDGPILAFIATENEAHPSLAGNCLNDSNEEANAESGHAEANSSGDCADFGLLYPLHGNESRPKDGRDDIKEKAPQCTSEDATDEAIVGSFPTHAHRAFSKADDAAHDRPTKEADARDSVKDIPEADPDSTRGSADDSAKQGAFGHVLGRALEVTRNNP